MATDMFAERGSEQMEVSIGKHEGFAKLGGSCLTLVVYHCPS